MAKITHQESTPNDTKVQNSFPSPLSEIRILNVPSADSCPTSRSSFTKRESQRESFTASVVRNDDEEENDVRDVEDYQQRELFPSFRNHFLESESDLEATDENERENNTELTNEQRLIREQEESENLARQLMAQEAMESYRLSTHFLEENAAAYSPEDLAALQAALGEGDSLEDSINEDDETDEELSYEAMLRISERLGDVKQERWEMVATKEISKLPIVNYTDFLVNNFKAGDDFLCKCLICQCSYEEGEKLRKLPCNHYFHAECVDQWLQSKWKCPYCRQSII